VQNLTGLAFDLKLDFPAFILLLIFLLGLYVLWKTQKADNGFDFSEMLRDDSGKPSSSRLAVFVCLAVSTWAIMYMLITNKGVIDTWIFIAYVAIWSGAKVAERFIDGYLANRGIPNNVPPGTTKVAATTTQVTTVQKRTVAAAQTAPAEDQDEPAH
jgi:hypothetical protein